MSTTVAGPVERNAGLSAEFREKKEVVDVPPVPSEYRKLESGEDYIAKQVADGFEQRTCVRSGMYLLDRYPYGTHTLQESMFWTTSKIM
jgi:hypothetical protein